MNRLGWFLLLLFIAAGALFFAMLNSSGDVAPAPTPSATAAAQATGTLVIPVAGIRPEQLSDTWGDSRGGGSRQHNAIDIMAPRGTLVVAAAPGTVEKLFNSNDGGLTVYVRSKDGGAVHYYAHLDAYRDGLAEGQPVATGEVLGTVGSTGNASPEAPHLHFEVKQMADGERWHQGEAINPYPLLAGSDARR